MRIFDLHKRKTIMSTIKAQYQAKTTIWVEKLKEASTIAVRPDFERMLCRKIESVSNLIWQMGIDLPWMDAPKFEAACAKVEARFNEIFALGATAVHA